MNSKHTQEAQYEMENEIKNEVASMEYVRMMEYDLEHADDIMEAQAEGHRQVWEEEQELKKQLKKAHPLVRGYITELEGDFECVRKLRREDIKEIKELKIKYEPSYTKKKVIRRKKNNT